MFIPVSFAAVVMFVYAFTERDLKYAIRKTFRIFLKSLALFAGALFSFSFLTWLAK